jgi:hypothetical protein
MGHTVLFTENRPDVSIPFPRVCQFRLVFLTVPTGTSGPTPTITGVVPAAAVATDVPSTLTDENVNMDAPPDSPGDSMEDETMAASGGA